MAFGNRHHNPLGHDDDGHGGLMITPLLDLFVALIPFLIMSAVLVRINIVDVAVSKPVAVVKKSDSPFNLHIKVGMTDAKLLLNNKVLKSLNIDSDGKWLAELHGALVDVKRSNLDRMEIRIEPTSAKVKLESLMGVMDTARSLQKTDGEILREDKASGEKVKLKFLFPKVIIRGVYT